MPSIAILGLGAIGTLMAHHCRYHNLFAASRSGSAIERTLITLPGEPVSICLPAWQGQPIDWLIVTTKAAQTLDALAMWEEYLPQARRILLLQNGMGQQETLLEKIHQQQLKTELWLGTTTEGAYRRGDRSSGNEVVYAGKGATRIGRVWPEATETKETAETTADLLSEAERPFAGMEIVPDIWLPIREKLAINAVINPLTANLRCLNGELISKVEYQHQTFALIEEVNTALQQLGWELSFDLSDRVQQVAIATGANRSSTLQDVLAGRKTELSHISGYLISRMHKEGLTMPISESLMAGIGE